MPQLVERGIRKCIPFFKGIGSKVNVQARLEFEIAYFSITIQHVYHCAMGGSSYAFV